MHYVARLPLANPARSHHCIGMSNSDEPTPKKPGAVKHDARGQAIWQWAADTGRHAVDSTSRLLKRLEVPGLKVEEYDSSKSSQSEPTQGEAGTPGAAAPQRPVPQRAQPPDTLKGYDPYGGRNDTKRAAPGQPAKKTGLKPTAAPAARVMKPGEKPATRRSLLERLFRK